MNDTEAASTLVSGPYFCHQLLILCGMKKDIKEENTIIQAEEELAVAEAKEEDPLINASNCGAEVENSNKECGVAEAKVNDDDDDDETKENNAVDSDKKVNEEIEGKSKNNSKETSADDQSKSKSRSDELHSSRGGRDYDHRDNRRGDDGRFQRDSRGGDGGGFRFKKSRVPFDITEMKYEQYVEA